MRFQYCTHCDSPLRIRVTHFEHDPDGHPRITMTKDDYAYNSYSYVNQSNEEITDAWCDHCGVKYHTG